jgi:hypothetical protein
VVQHFGKKIIRNSESYRGLTLGKEVGLSMRSKSEFTKKRYQISLLLKRAKSGKRQAKDRLLRDFGIRLYSPKEVEEYVRRKLKTEVVDELPSRLRAKPARKTEPNGKRRQMAKKA